MAKAVSIYERDAMRSAMRGVMRDKFNNRFCIVFVVMSPFKRGIMRSVMRDKIITHRSLHVAIGCVIIFIMHTSYRGELL